MLAVCNVATACHIGKFLYGCTLLCYTPVETRGLRITLARRWSDFVFMLTCSLKYVYIQQGDVVLCTVPIVSLHLRYIRKRPGLIGLDPLRKDFNLILPSGGTSLPSTSHLFLFGDCYPVEKTVPLAQVIATRMTEMLLWKEKVNSIYEKLTLYICWTAKCFPTFFDLLPKIAPWRWVITPPPNHTRTKRYFNKNVQLFWLHTQLKWYKWQTRFINSNATAVM